MNHNEFFKTLREGQLFPVYLFSGEEEYVKASALKQLEAAVIDPALREVNLTLLGPSAGAEEICAQCETVPCMGEKRLVIVEDSMFLTKSKSEEEERLLTYLESPADFTVLVFCAAAPDKRRKLFKALQKYTVDFAPLSSPELIRWIEKTFKSSGLSIERSDALFLTEYADSRPEALCSELEKLSCYVKEGQVKREDILAAVTPCKEYNIFKMTDAVTERDAQKALALLSGMLVQKEEPLYILGAVSRQYRQLLRFKLLQQEKAQKQEIIAALGIRDFVFARLQRTCEKLSEQKLKQAVDLCYEADEGLKTGKQLPAVALHRLILRLCAL